VNSITLVSKAGDRAPLVWCWFEAVETEYVVEIAVLGNLSLSLSKLGRGRRRSDKVFGGYVYHRSRDMGLKDHPFTTPFVLVPFSS
jgi:hypothetical protein